MAEEHLTAEEEYELMYADDLEVLNEIEHSESEILGNLTQAKKDCKKRLYEDDGFEEMVDKENALVIDEDDCLHPKKKKKSEEFQLVNFEEEIVKDEDSLLSEKILAHRKHQKDFDTLLADKNWGFKSKNHNNQPKLHKRLPHGDFQAITMSTGYRYYLNVKTESLFNKTVSEVTVNRQEDYLLNVPYATLRAEAVKEMEKMIDRQQKHKQHSKGFNVKFKDYESDSGVEDDSQDLWVEKYRPKHYLDLLSDEATNRTVLRWMKLWDKTVFGIESKRKKQKKDNPNTNSTGSSNFKPKNYSKFAPEVIEELDEQNRPQQKVVLLCGAPGLGKTTLAHIIAVHAGYNIVEINASDDRSTETFQKNLENATTMKAVFGDTKKPNCLIVDEIDGAPLASINLLVKVVQGKSSVDRRKSMKKETPRSLQRPVICICNDLYVPALRPLKQVALIVHFPPTLSARLAKRLQVISAKQQLKTDLSALMTLCDKTENDIRSCLSVLQFVRSNRNALRISDLSGITVGQKDYHRSLFFVWNSIFAMSRQKRKRHLNPHEVVPNSEGLIEAKQDDPTEQSTLKKRVLQMLKTAQSCGEYEKLTLGWFENYTSVKLKRTDLWPVSVGLEWAMFTDVMQKEILHSQNWALQAYLPYACVAYHLIFASNHKNKISFPSMHNDHLSSKSKNEYTITSLQSEMAPLSRIFCPPAVLVADVLPFLITIIQPNVRPVDFHLLSAKEKEELKGLVNTMIFYNLTYLQEKNANGHYAYNLDPNIENLVSLGEMVPQYNRLGYSSRQLIAREIELEKLRKCQIYFSAQSNSAQKQTNSVSERTTTVPHESLPNHLHKLELKKKVITNTTKPAKDFFGRVLVVTSSQESSASSPSDPKCDVWYKFKGGYSNAVRRPVKLKDIFK